MAKSIGMGLMAAIAFGVGGGVTIPQDAPRRRTKFRANWDQKRVQRSKAAARRLNLKRIATKSRKRNWKVGR